MLQPGCGALWVVRRQRRRPAPPPLKLPSILISHMTLIRVTALLPVKQILMLLPRTKSGMPWDLIQTLDRARAFPQSGTFIVFALARRRVLFRQPSAS